MINRFSSFLLFIVLLASNLFAMSSASALSFNQGKIIDDQVFNNTDSMSASQIDSWINSNFGSTSCISTSHGFSAPDPTGYSPSGGFTYGGNVSAGQVIYDSAQAYGLNPQVLLATLQKEQSLVSGGSGCSTLAYTGAVGYGCPDGGSTYSYSGVDLYSINGNEVTSVSGTCVNSSSKVGFSQQVIHAAWLLKFGEERSEGNVGWAVIKGNWDNSDDPQSCYSGPMTQGTWQICPGGPSTYYDGFTTIDGTAVQIQDGATAALYWYTPHFSGNQNFYNIFTSWFGSTTAMFGVIPSIDSNNSKEACNIGTYSSTMVGRLYQPDTGDYFYTTNDAEACSAVKLGYIWDGIVMQSATGANAVPVYRMSNQFRHFYTISPTVRAEYLASGYNDEGIAFYAYATSQPNSLPVYELTDGLSYLLTSAGAEGQLFMDSYGFQPEGIAFYTPNIDSSGEQPVIRMAKANGERFYTISPTEASIDQTYYGYMSEGTASLDNVMPDVSNEPVYRLAGPGSHFYTTNRLERDTAVIDDGYTSEGIGFYAPNSSWPNAIPIYRATNNGNDFRLYTASQQELTNAVNLYNYISEGVGWYGYPN